MKDKLDLYDGLVEFLRSAERAFGEKGELEHSATLKLAKAAGFESTARILRRRGVNLSASNWAQWERVVETVVGVEVANRLYVAMALRYRRYA